MILLCKQGCGRAVHKTPGALYCGLCRDYSRPGETGLVMCGIFIAAIVCLLTAVVVTLSAKQAHAKTVRYTKEVYESVDEDGTKKEIGADYDADQKPAADEDDRVESRVQERERVKAILGVEEDE